MTIRKVSKKLSILNAEYSKLRKEFLSKNTTCHARISGCRSYATEIHHKRGRGTYLLDINTWLPVCRICHNWIENNPADAKELGFSESRL